MKHSGRLVLFVTSTLAISLAAAPASAQSDSGQELGNAIANAIIASINQARVNHTAHTWDGVEDDVKMCMAERQRLPVPDLIKNLISANDTRIAPQLAQCRQFVQEQREAAAEAQRVATEQAALAQQQREAEAQAEAERVALEAQAAEARRADLTRRYGAAHANAILAGQVAVGMGPDEVTAAVGEPTQREQLTPTDAIWYYNGRRISFSNGHVAAIRN